MRIQLSLLGLAHEFHQSLAKTPRTAEVDAAVERQREEASQVIRWKERVREGFLSLPVLEELRSALLAHLERQFPRPERRR